MYEPVLQRDSTTRLSLDGPFAEYLRGVTAQWLLVAPLANPAMLEMFRDRDRLPARNLVEWAGEFAGKYLTGATQFLRVSGDPTLRGFLGKFVRALVSLQAEDGYLGPWGRDHRLTNEAPNAGDTAYTHARTWDTWGHYHVMLGLLLWCEETGDAAALACAARIGDLLCAKYLGVVVPRLVDTGNTEMNLAPVHSLCRLYRHTGDARHLALAQQLADEFAAVDADGTALAGDYWHGPLAGKEFFQLPRPRWESLHPIMGLVELYYLTGDLSYREAFTRIWWSIVQWDRHNNGGFSSGEQAQGNPYHPGAIETCCTIAWMALSVEMLHLTGDAVVADELELSTWNSVLGMHSATGRWATYNTPMDGVREASAHNIVFQSRPGSPELNCCSVNSARGFGLLSEWALLHDADGLVLNWYGPGTLRTSLPDGAEVTITQDTTYPCDAQVTLRIAVTTPTRFALKIRIPHWSTHTVVRCDEEDVPPVVPGAYLTLERVWKLGATVEIQFDFSMHYWVGAEQCAGFTSIYRGPLLLTYDRRFNEMDPDDVPPLSAATLQPRRIAWPGWLPPVLLVECTAEDGRTVRLCDFGSAGEAGNPYRSWLPVTGVDATPYSPRHPRRSGPLEA